MIGVVLYVSIWWAMPSGVGVVVVLGAEFPGQPLLHTAVSHAEVMPAADQQADNRCECQAGADDLQDHACRFVHNTPPVSVLWQ